LSIKKLCLKQLVERESCFKHTAEAGKELQDQGLNPAILNMASSKPGSEFITGFQAQEECLCVIAHYNKETQFHLFEQCPQHSPLQSQLWTLHKLLLAQNRKKLCCGLGTRCCSHPYSQCYLFVSRLVLNKWALFDIICLGDVLG